MEQIRKYFERSISITDDEWRVFSSKLICQKYPKKQKLLDIGETEDYLSFIEKGILRFYIPKEESDFTFSFSFDDEFASAYDSFLTQKPSKYVVETLTEAVLWRISYKDLQQIYRQTKIGNEIGRLASEKLYLENIERELSLLTLTAEKRYLRLFTEQPRLLRQIPLKYIASYIGITPQALSRIRRQIS
ncbi:Crp/Fnr family transcriptional regulator [Sphingobacterium shayense]|uniref:Crp/Fnr family transcriptional regulator n=1 Tax=Sphingobacterium shayense TaxID=626343 RepID=UPI0015576EAA|nr:Crp/Fnr family transcriptional regulator [Sphingobacterium shayense]NQD70408.1 Crp/Fnr family transcriptional regulator [Sphingobacterium shayense]